MLPVGLFHQRAELSTIQSRHTHFRPHDEKQKALRELPSPEAWGNDRDEEPEYPGASTARFEIFPGAEVRDVLSEAKAMLVDHMSERLA